MDWAYKFFYTSMILRKIHFQKAYNCLSLITIDIAYVFYGISNIYIYIYILKHEIRKKDIYKK